MKLKKYIDDIDSGKPINLSKFIGVIKGLSISHKFNSSDVSARKIRGQLYSVTHINEQLLQKLRLLISEAGNDRISAARQNRSHSHKVNGSILLVREGVQHPNVVIFDEHGDFHYPNNVSNTALLIENRQNFISIQHTLEFLKKYTSFKFEYGFDVVFAVGNEISNSLHNRFLSQYKHLYLFFDFDLGGLTISKNLFALLPNKNLEFLVPTNIQDRLTNVVEKQPPEYIDNVIKLGIECPQLAPFAKLIKDYNRILEQESYLYDE